MNSHDIEQVLLSRGHAWMSKLEAKIANDCNSVGISALDVVSKAFLYLHKKAMEGGDIEKKTQNEEGLYSMMASKARWLLSDAARAAKLDHGRKSVRTTESLDRQIDDEEGSGYAPLENHASIIRWSEICRQQEQTHLCHAAKIVLDQFFEMRKISPTNRLIYKCVVLHEMPCEKVAERYGTTTNNVYQVVSRITKGLREEGRRLYDELCLRAA